jgi:hypothetical protein
MSIILRTLKGSALTYEEMDRNMSQYFYSSSVHSSGTELRLHYTGSDSLDTPSEDYGPTRYQAVAIGSGGSSSGVTRIIAGTGVTILPTEGVGVVTINATGAGASPGGSDGSVQFRSNSTTFGGNSDLFYNASTTRLGLGTNLPESKLHIVGNQINTATIRLASPGGATRVTNTAQIDIYNGTQKLGSFGKTDENTEDIFVGAERSLRFGIVGSTIGSVTATGLGILREDPNRPLVVVGDGGIGIQKNVGEASDAPQSILQPIPQSIFNSKVIPNTQARGLFISPPLSSAEQGIYGGHVVVSLNTTIGQSTTNSNSFSIVSSTDQDYTRAIPIATFRADRTVGIALPSGEAPATTLDVNGQIRGAYFTYPIDTTTLSLNTKKVVKVSYSTNKTVTSAAGAAGVEAVLILTGGQGDGVDPIEIAFGSNFYVQYPGTINLTNDTTYTMSFVCDGTNWYETSRTTALTAGF